MIEQVLQSVKQTEQQAAALVTAAEEEAARLRRDTQQQIAAEWDQTKQRAKAHRIDRLEEAEGQAQAKAQAIAQQSKKDCETLAAMAEGRMDALVQQLTERILHGDC